MSYDDETLMAFADGELDAAQRAEISAAIARDPALARRVEKHRALRADVGGAFAAVLDQPVPERLTAAAGGVGAGAPASASSTPLERGRVLQFPKRGAQGQGPRWRAREWFAMAASLLLGIAISWRLFSPEPGLMDAKGGALVARGALASALERQLASNQPADSAVLIGLTFRAHDGGWCRSFTVRATNTAGLACRANGEWQIPVTASAAHGEGAIQQASGSIPPAVLAAIEARMSGDAVDAADEENAHLGGWKPEPAAGTPPPN